MRFIPIFVIAFLAVVSCKETPKSTQPELSLPERIAKAHGVDYWRDVEEIRFTFNVDRDTTHYERGWSWNPHSQQVTLYQEGDTTTYLRDAVDSTLTRADAGFINDKFWLLLPYQLDWDRANYTYDVAEKIAAPISGDSLTKLTIVYGDKGGYTPGDAYDLYVGEDHLLREWTFRKGNQPDPSMSTTWEGYESFGELKIATRHRNPERGTTLYFTGVEVKMK